MKKTVVLIDDELNALEVMKIQLNELFANEIEVVASFSDSRKAIEWLPTIDPDLIFLDIEMPFKSGFDVIEETQGIKYQVIFTTAYSEFAIKAFKVSAVDYLLKPIEEKELEQAVNKFLKSNSKTNINLQIEELKKHLTGSIQDKRIAINIGDSVSFYYPDEIIRLQSDSNYTDIFLKNGKKITTAKTLKEIENKLTSQVFFRLHHSHIINLNFIKSHIKGNAGYVKMIDESLIPISRPKKDEFLKLFDNI